MILTQYSTFLNICSKLNFHILPTSSFQWVWCYNIEKKTETYWYLKGMKSCFFIFFGTTMRNKSISILHKTETAVLDSGGKAYWARDSYMCPFRNKIIIVIWLIFITAAFRTCDSISAKIISSWAILMSICKVVEMSKFRVRRWFFESQLM